MVIRASAKAMKRMFGEPGTAVDQLKRELHQALETIHTELDRVEILSAALEAFNQPVPDYEPNFRHVRHLTTKAVELK